MMKQKNNFFNLPIPPETIERRILIVRGQKVMLDSDLAEPYQVPTKRLNEAVSINMKRFPGDFMFQLSKPEHKNLIFQFGISSLRSQIAASSYGGRRHLPYVFTEHGVAMLSSVLHSQRAIEMDIFIIRAFVKLREMLATHKDLANKIEKIEAKQKQHSSIITFLVEDIRKLKSSPSPPQKKIGFRSD
jgi:hypothetical protein